MRSEEDIDRDDVYLTLLQKHGVNLDTRIWIMHGNRALVVGLPEHNMSVSA